MTALYPSSLRKGFHASLALTAAALVALTGSDASAKMPNIKRQADVSISFDLLATPEAPVGATGLAEIELEETRYSEKAELKVDVDGLAAGTYAVDAILNDSTTTVHIGNITVAETPAPAPGTTTTETGDDTPEAPEVEDETEAELELTLPSSVDARAIATITVSTVPVDNTTAPVVLLTGEAEAATSYLNFFANVRVTAPPASALTQTPSPTEDTTTEVESGKGKGKGKSKSKGPKAPKVKKVHGHALAKAVITNSVAKKRFFQFIGFGAPGSTTLNIVENGETVGTVTSTKQGHVKFRSLPEDIDFGALDLVTITDANGVPVMQADF
jgi:hypothetical protein